MSDWDSRYVLVVWGIGAAAVFTVHFYRGLWKRYAPPDQAPLDESVQRVAEVVAWPAIFAWSLVLLAGVLWFRVTGRDPSTGRSTRKRPRSRGDAPGSPPSP